MYVCNCNGLNRRAVDQAIANGAHSPAAIFRELDCKAQCGKCVGEMRGLITACRHLDARGPASRHDHGAAAPMHYLLAAE